MYIDLAYLNAQLGASTVASLSRDSAGLNQMIRSAESIVDGAMKAGGYSRRTATSTIGDTPELVKTAVFGQWMMLSNASHAINVREQYADALGLLDDIRNGILEIDGEQKSTVRGPGGVTFSNSNPSSEGSRAQMFSRKRMWGF